MLTTYLHAGSIDFTIATMTKCDRSATSEVYVTGFVPCYQLPHKRPCSIDPFLHPFISEIEDIFINGKSAVATIYLGGRSPGGIW